MADVFFVSSRSSIFYFVLCTVSPADVPFFLCVCVDFRFFDGGIFLFVVSCFCSRHSNIHTHHFLVYVWLCSYMCVSCVVTLVLLDKKNCCRFSFFYWISSKLPTQKQNDSNGNNILFRQLSCCFQIEKK